MRYNLKFINDLNKNSQQFLFSKFCLLLFYLGKNQEGFRK